MQEIARRPLCPYGKLLQAYKNEAIKLEFPIYVFVGNRAQAEAFANKRMGTMCSYIPLDKTFEDFSWPIEGQSIVLTDTGGSSVLGMKKLCHKFLRQGAKSVCLFTELCPIEVFTLKDVIHVV